MMKNEKAECREHPASGSQVGPLFRGGSRSLLLIYLVNATLVICHEIDSAYWHEWDLFHLPGGSTGFVAMHFLIVPLLLVGLLRTARGAADARWWSLAIGVGGLSGFAAHLAFIASGDTRFATTFSLGLIVAFGISSAALVLAAGRMRTLDRYQRTP